MILADIWRDFSQPEYIHVLLNPLPVYGLATGCLGLFIALILRSRRGQIATLVVVLLTAASAWPVKEYGEQAYDRVLSMTDADGPTRVSPASASAVAKAARSERKP